MKGPDREPLLVITDDNRILEGEEALRAAYARIQDGKTPPPMKDPYSGLPMNRHQRRAMGKKVANRIKRKEKEA